MKQRKDQKKAISIRQIKLTFSHLNYKREKGPADRRWGMTKGCVNGPAYVNKITAD